MSDMPIKKAIMIAESLPSLYHLQPFEEDALHTLLSAMRWIPVTERLPEEDVNVLCQTFGGTRLVASYGILNPYHWSTEKGWITAEFNRFSKETVRVWMSLPEPFRGDKHE